LEITDAIQVLIDDGHDVRATIVTGWWLDTGKKDDLLEANRIILDACVDCEIKGDVDEASQVIGRVNIGPGSRITNCTIRGPIAIGRNCHLENCFIGPYSSIADDVTLIDMDLEHSVILKGARLEGVPHRIVDSLIGQRASLKPAASRPKAVRLMIGDDSQIELV
jgi:glucose-1-phosphate thymidylyltransferase